jgi:hypothetical protein
VTISGISLELTDSGVQVLDGQDTGLMVGQLTGTATVVESGAAAAHTTLWLDVNGSSCLQPTAISFDLDRWRAALRSGDLRVYVYGGPKIPKVVGIEPAPD